MNRRSYFIAIAIVLLLVGLITLYVFEFHYLNRTLHARRLVLGSVAAGAGVGFLLARRFRRSAADATERVQLYLFFMVLCALFAPLFGSLSNRLLTWRAPRAVPVEFVEEEARYESLYGLVKGETPRPNAYYLFFYKDNRLYRVKNDTSRFAGHQRGDTVMLTMRRGLWGFELVADD